MRTFALVLVFALAPTLALAAVPPLACSGTCDITAMGAGYVTPASAITSGTNVTWTSVDAPHVTSDGTAAGDNCFIAKSGDVVRFDIVAGALVATQGQESVTCASARALPDGSLVMPYFCRLHPNMRGALVVRI